MDLSFARRLKIMRATILPSLVLLFLIASPIYLTDINEIELEPTAAVEVIWKDAMQACNSYGADWSLPSIYQLAAIYYRRPDIALVKQTDYWSRNSFAGFAFGLNTGRGIASFDRHSDTDHYLCVKLK